MSRFVLTAQLQLQAPSNVRQVVNQIQSQLAGVNVPINVQGATSATRQINQIKAATNDATTAAERMGTAFGVSLKRFASFSIATRAVGLFTSGLAGAIKDAIAFERELIKVAQVSNQSISSLKGLTSTITELATSLGVESKSLLEVSTILKQAGLSANDTSIALRTLAKAALAPNFDSITETTEGAIAILAQFGLGVQSLEGQLSSIDAVAGAFAVEASDLIDVIRRTGGVFKSSGGDLNELIALFTSVRATTRESAESIGTGLRTIFTRIQRPKTIEFLKQFGVELVDLEGKFVGPFEAVKRLSAALNGLGEGDLTFIRVAEELGGFRQIGKVLPLLQQFAMAQDALNVAQNAGNGLTQNAVTAQQALAIRITKVKEEFLAFVRGLTESKGFQIFVNTALNLASAFIKIGEALTPVIPLLTAMMAINISRGIGSFLTSIPRGVASNRLSGGGRVLGFEKGGLVPGVGNRDSVPAMLTPGEVVMNRTAVQKYGAGNLVKMNNRAKGGPITVEELKAINPNSVQPDYRNEQLANFKTGENDNTWSKYKMDGKLGKVRTTAIKYMQPSDKVFGEVNYIPVQDPNRVEVEKYFGNISFPKGTKFINPKDKKIATAYEAYVESKMNGIGARFTGTYDPLDFETGDAKFYSSEENIAKYASINKVLSKRLRYENVKKRIAWNPSTPETKELQTTNIYHPTDLSSNNNLKSRLTEWLLLNQSQKTSQAMKAGQDFNIGGLVQRFEEGGVAQRRVGIIDSDVLRNKKNAARVAEGMKLLDAKSEADYAIKLSKLAGESRQAGSLSRFSVMAGAAANRKSSVATGRGAKDDATLRKTTRKQILHPDDLKDVDQVMSLTTTLKDSKLDYMGMADRIYVKDSSTEDEQKLVKLFERQRNLQKDPTLYGRETGTTEGLNPDYGLQTASLISQFGTTEDRTNKGKVMTLGEKTDQEGNPRFQIRRKRFEELPELVSAKGQFPGAASPLTRGHAETAVGTLLAKVREKYPDATHKDLLFALAPDLSLSGGSQGREHGSRYGEYPASFRRDLIKLALPEMMISSANSPSQTGINSRIAEIEKGSTGRRRFAVMEKDAPVVISKAENENPEGVMERYREAGLKPYNIARSSDVKGKSISGTAARQAVVDKDYDTLDLAVLPQVGSAIKANQPQLRNRRMMVPLVQQALDIFTQANASKVNEQVDSILQNASGGPFTRMTPKFKESHPNLVKQIQQLRSSRDIFEREAFLDPAHELIRIISDRYPDIYGLDVSRKEPVDIPVNEDSIKQHIIDASKSSSYFRPGLSFNGDGIQLSPTLQKVKDAVDKEVKSEVVAEPKVEKEIVAPDSRSEIFKILSREEAAEAAGVDRFKAYDIMGIRKELTPEQQKVKDAIKAAYVKKVKRQGASAKAQTTKLREKGLEFGAAGLFGKAFAAKNIKIESDKLSSPRMVRVNSGVMDQVTATRLSTTMSQGVSDIISQGTNIVRAGQSKSPPTQNPLQGLNTNTNATIQGGLIEQIIQQLGGPGAVKGKGFDFPEGLQGAAKYFNIDPSIPTDVKRTLSGPSTIKDNIVTYLKNVMGYNSGGLVQKFPIGGRVSRKVPNDKVGGDPFAKAANSNTLGSSAYDLEKSSGLSPTEFEQAYQYAKTAQFNIEEFKKDLARRLEAKKQKSQIKTDPSSLSQQLMQQAKRSTDKQIALGKTLQDTSNDIGYRPSDLERIAQARADVSNATRYAVGGVAEAGKKEDKQYGQISITEDAGMISVGYQKGDNRQGYATGYKMRDNLYYVGLSKATKGYGPRLYDVLMEAVTEKGAMLTSDRSSVSEDAKRVWEYYFKNRGDVKKTPLKPSDWTVNSELIDPKLYGKKETWPPATDPAWTLQTGYSKSPRLITDTNEVIRKRFGGRLGFETGGTVPALVSNGEAYVPPKVAKRIGYGTLNRMNQADRNGMGRFSSGGGISVFKGPGTGTSDSIPANLPVGSFIVRAKATKALGFNRGGAVAIRQKFASGGKPVSSRDVKSYVQSDTSAITKEIAATSQEIKKTGDYAKRLSGSIDKQNKITNVLYQESSVLDAKIQKYASELNRLAAQQGKAIATGTAANRIVQLRTEAETKRIALENKALAEDQKLEGIKKKHADTLLQQTKLMEKKNSLISDAKAIKESSTKDVQSILIKPEASSPQNAETSKDCVKLCDPVLDTLNSTLSELLKAIQALSSSASILPQQSKAPDPKMSVAEASTLASTPNNDMFKQSTEDLSKAIEVLTEDFKKQREELRKTSTSTEDYEKGLQEIDKAEKNRLKNINVELKARKQAPVNAQRKKEVASKQRKEAAQSFMSDRNLNKVNTAISNKKGYTLDNEQLTRAATTVKTKFSEEREKAKSEATDKKDYDQRIKTINENENSQLKGINREAKNRGIDIGGGEKSDKSMFTFSQALTGASAALNGLIQTAGGTDDAFTRIATSALSSVTAISSSLSILESVAGIEITGFKDIAEIPAKLGESFSNVGAILDEKVAGLFGKSSSSPVFENLFKSMGAVAGVAAITASAFSAAAGILYSTSTTIADYDKAMADGNIALVGTLSARKTAEEDIINSGGMFAGGIVAVAAAVPLLLGAIFAMIPGFAGASAAAYAFALPVAAIVASIVGIAAIALYATGNLEVFANGVRDFASDLTGGWIQSTSTIQQFAQATAATSHTMKLMQDQAKQTTQALKDLSEGRKSAKEVLNQFSGQAKSASNAQSMANLLPQDTAKQKKDRDAAIKQANENKNKVLSDAAPAINAQARNIAVAGGDFAEFFASLPKELQAIYNQNPEELNLLKQAFGNTAKDIEVAKKAFEAMNLGLRNVTSVTGSAVNSITNFTAGLQVGNLAVAQSANTLTAALTDAGANISQNDVNNALNDVAGTMSALGATDQQVAKFKDNLTALAQVQRNTSGIFDQVKANIQAGAYTNMSPEDVGNDFRKLVDEQLKASGIGDEARKRIGDALGDIEIGEKEREQIANGDYSFLTKKLEEAGVTLTKPINQMVSDLQKINAELTPLYKQRIESERALVEAQRQSIALSLEGLDIQAKYGGAAVTPEIRRQAALESANVGRRRLGLEDVRGSDPNSLRAGLNQIRGNFSALEQKALQGKVSGPEGVKDEGMRENLKKAQQDQVKLIRDLISAEEEQLKLTKEKNKLEKDSLESLLAGDIDKFFEQQAAVGATAAIASGNQTAINQFGGQALGGAYQNLQRQKDAGVTELFGQRIAGAGGLLESSAMASLGSRGIQNPRMAQILAGTTQEEEASSRRLREYGGLLGEAGAAGAEMAQMEVARAEMNIAKAELRIENAGVSDILNNQPQARSRGGIVYASKGQLINFVPKGTDTVPAMLTPGEFVINRGAVNRGDNLSFLRAINNGNYTASAQRLNSNNTSIPSIMKQLSGSPQVIQTQETQKKMVQNERSISNVNFDVQKLSKQLGKFMSGFDGFMESFSDQVGKLGNTEVSHKMGDVNLNINGGQFLQSMADGLKQQLMQDLGQQLQSIKINNVGNIKLGRTSVL